MGLGLLKAVGRAVHLLSPQVTDLRHEGEDVPLRVGEEMPRRVGRVVLNAGAETLLKRVKVERRVVNARAG
jgi:hypothetical protein